MNAEVRVLLVAVSVANVALSLAVDVVRSLAVAVARLAMAYTVSCW